MADTTTFAASSVGLPAVLLVLVILAALVYLLANVAGRAFRRGRR